MKTLELTDREIELLATALATHVAELMRQPPESCLPTPQMADEINELHDLEWDLREILNRDDGWEQTAEAQFIEAGIDAREAQKARAIQAFGDSDMRLGSMAAQRRAAERSVQRMMLGTATPVMIEEDE